MKATDLMIGDWVFHKGNPIQVYNVFNGSINETYYSFSNEVANYIPESEIDPIPLTKEILEKNGFKEKSEMFKYYRGIEEPKIYEVKDKKYYIEEDLELDGNFLGYIFSVFNIDDEDGAVLNSVVEIKSVHELQHALRLCGIDKEIVL